MAESMGNYVGFLALVYRVTSNIYFYYIYALKSDIGR